MLTRFLVGALLAAIAGFALLFVGSIVGSMAISASNNPGVLFDAVTGFLKVMGLFVAGLIIFGVLAYGLVFICGKLMARFPEGHRSKLVERFPMIPKIVGVALGLIQVLGAGLVLCLIGYIVVGGFISSCSEPYRCTSGAARFGGC